MPQASATWDNNVLGCPEGRDYAVTMESVHLQSQPIDGSTRLRRLQQEPLLTLDLRVQQTQAQFDAFRDFYFNDLNAGEGWFLMPLMFGLSSLVLVCNIRNGFQQARNDTVHGYYLTTFSVDALRKVSVPYTPVPLEFIAPGGPDNPNLGTLDDIDPLGPDNPNLGTLDVVDGNAQVGLPS